MINPFLLDYKARLQAWKTCRHTISETAQMDQALDVCLQFWRQAPLENHLLDWDNHETWPTVWEMLNHNSYCTSMHSLGIAETLRLSDTRWQQVQLWCIRDQQAHVEKVITVCDAWVLNHGYLDKLPRHQLQHVHAQYKWHHTGRHWQLM